jgi:hypothetical protein
MARSKATITLDRQKVRTAMELSGRTSMSDAIDLALDRFIGTVELRRDVAAYLRQPLDAQDTAPTEMDLVLDLDDDDVDYDALYGASG